MKISVKTLRSGCKLLSLDLLPQANVQDNSNTRINHQNLQRENMIQKLKNDIKPHQFGASAKIGAI